MMKNFLAILLAGLLCTGNLSAKSKVYFTSKIDSGQLVKIFNALGVKPKGEVAVKISTGESAQTYYLRPDFIRPLVDQVNGTLVECNTAYGGNRSTTENHRKAIEERGFTAQNGFKPLDIMDAEDTIHIPVRDQKWIRYDIVGSHLKDYDFMINLAHFKGHQMGGFGGVLKNASIGVAASSGKAYIHSAGASEKNPWGNRNQDSFLESMAAAAQAVHDYFGGKVVYINVMNNMSVDCDCNGHPQKPLLDDIGILASTDPVALDRACLDLIFSHQDSEGNTAKPLQQRISQMHGEHIVTYAEQLGLGSQSYKLIDIDKK